MDDNEKMKREFNLFQFRMEDLYSDEKMKLLESRYSFVVEDCKRYFGQWDVCDPVVWAILRLVQAQNDMMNAINESSETGGPASERMVEAAIAERREAVDALLRAIEREPRGFQ